MYRIRRPAFAVGIPLVAAFVLLVTWSVGATQSTELPSLTLTEPAVDPAVHTVGLDVFADPLAFPEPVQRADVLEQWIATREGPPGGGIEAFPSNGMSQASWSIANETWGLSVVNSPQDGSFSVPVADDNTQPATGFEVWSTGVPVQAAGLTNYRAPALGAMVPDAQLVAASGWEFWSTTDPVQAAGLASYQAAGLASYQAAGLASYQAAGLDTMAGQERQQVAVDDWQFWSLVNGVRAPALDSYQVQGLDVASATPSVTWGAADGGGGLGRGEPSSGIIHWPIWDDAPTAPAFEGFGGVRVSALAEGQ